MRIAMKKRKLGSPFRVFIFYIVRKRAQTCHLYTPGQLSATEALIDDRALRRFTHSSAKISFRASSLSHFGCCVAFHMRRSVTLPLSPLENHVHKGSYLNVGPSTSRNRTSCKASLCEVVEVFSSTANGICKGPGMPN